MSDGTALAGNPLQTKRIEEQAAGKMPPLYGADLYSVGSGTRSWNNSLRFQSTVCGCL